MPYLACDGSNRIRKFLSAETVKARGGWYSLMMLTLVLNSVQKRSDELRLKDYCSIEVLSHSQR